MPRAWLPGDPHYGEYQTILFDRAEDDSTAVRDIADEVFADLAGEAILDLE